MSQYPDDPNRDKAPESGQGGGEHQDYEGYTAEPNAIEGEPQGSHPVPPSLGPGPRTQAPPPAQPGPSVPPQYGPQPGVYASQPYRPAPPPPGYRPPMPQGYGGYPPPPRPRSRVIPVIIGLIILFLIVSGGIAALVGSGDSSGSSSFGSFGIMGTRIGVLEVEGVLGEGDNYSANTKKLVDAVRQWKKNDSVAAIVVRINSPGGAVSATQDLYQALNEFRSSGPKGSRPVVVSMGDIAASGGYYTAMAADKVFANSGTLTGSVGVIMSFYDYQGLQGKVGVQSRVVKSGEFKDVGSGSRAMTPAEKAMLQTTIDDVYSQFFDAVVESRGEAVKELLNSADPEAVAEDDVRKFLSEHCQGQVFSGHQALTYGMVDEIGTLQDALKEAARMAGVPKDTSTVVAPQKTKGLFGALGNIANKVESLPRQFEGTARFEYRFAGW